MRRLAFAGVILAVSCSTASPPPASPPPASPSPSIVRTMAVAFSGGLTGSLTQINVPSRASEGSPVCGGTISNDPAGANYLLVGTVGTDEASLSFLIHGTQAAGSYPVGAYPDGTVAAPAVINVLIVRVGQGFASWNSGGGSLVIDPGGRSGTLSADLGFAGWRRISAYASPPPTTVLPPLHLQGSWVCPAGS